MNYLILLLLTLPLVSSLPRVSYFQSIFDLIEQPDRDPRRRVISTATLPPECAANSVKIHGDNPDLALYEDRYYHAIMNEASTLRFHDVCDSSRCEHKMDATACALRDTCIAAGGHWERLSMSLTCWNDTTTSDARDFLSYNSTRSVEIQDISLCVPQGCHDDLPALARPRLSSVAPHLQSQLELSNCSPFVVTSFEDNDERCRETETMNWDLLAESSDASCAAATQDLFEDELFEEAHLAFVHKEEAFLDTVQLDGVCDFDTRDCDIRLDMYHEVDWTLYGAACEAADGNVHLLDTWVKCTALSDNEYFRTISITLSGLPLCIPKDACDLGDVADFMTLDDGGEPTDIIEGYSCLFSVDPSYPDWSTATNEHCSSEMVDMFDDESFLEAHVANDGARLAYIASLGASEE